MGGGGGGDEISGATNGTGKPMEEDKDDNFWKVPLPLECMHFVNSPDSDSFSRLVLALERATVVAMDAEWKPLLHGSGKASAGQVPRVSILQIACRLQPQGKGAKESAESPSAGHTLKTPGEPQSKTSRSVKQEREQPPGQLFRLRNSQVGAENGAQPRDDEPTGEDRDKRSEEGVQCGPTALEGHTATREEPKTCSEMIFLLDLLAIPAAAFSKLLKKVFMDPAVLKLGFGFRQDLVHLRGTFPGPDAHGCFDKVEPYLDVGKLYRHLHANKSTFMSRGRRIMIGGEFSLTTISEKILGLPLSKDMQCSNWEQRPLTSRQFDYAVADAYCLLMMFDTLQLEASESWFSPHLTGDDGLCNRSKVGVAGLLTPDVVGIADKYAMDGICQPKRGDATAMVRAALGEASISGLRKDAADQHRFKSTVTVGKALSIEALVHRFGEKLLITEGQAVTNNRSRRKTRSRRAREAGKNRESQDEEDFQYMGPPPWDDAVGGDGIPKFLCDAMVEGLARQLRCVGIDAASPNSRKCEPRELVDLAEKEGRVILTRDVKLLRRKLVPTELAYRVKRQGKWDQLAEIIEIFELTISEDQLLTRCTKCNGRFIPKALTAKEAVAQGPWNQVIPDCVLKEVDEFWQCATCKHLYWQGSIFSRAFEQFVAVCHTGKQKTRMETTITELLP
ncbi:unnamed protein product [Calypogeia fissa]